MTFWVSQPLPFPSFPGLSHYPGPGHRRLAVHPRLQRGLLGLQTHAVRLGGCVKNVVAGHGDSTWDVTNWDGLGTLECEICPKNFLGDLRGISQANMVNTWDLSSKHVGFQCFSIKYFKLSCSRISALEMAISGVFFHRGMERRTAYAIAMCSWGQGMILWELGDPVTSTAMSMGNYPWASHLNSQVNCFQPLSRLSPSIRTRCILWLNFNPIADEIPISCG